MSSRDAAVEARTLASSSVEDHASPPGGRTAQFAQMSCQPGPPIRRPIPSHLRGRRPTPQGLERHRAPRSDQPRQGRTSRATGPPPGLKLADPTFPRWICPRHPIHVSPRRYSVRDAAPNHAAACPQSICSRSSHAIHPRRDLREDPARLNNGILLAGTHGRGRSRAANLQRRAPRAAKGKAPRQEEQRIWLPRA